MRGGKEQNKRSFGWLISWTSLSSVHISKNKFSSAVSSGILRERIMRLIMNTLCTWKMSGGTGLSVKCGNDYNFSTQHCTKTDTYPSCKALYTATNTWFILLYSPPPSCLRLIKSTPNCTTLALTSRPWHLQILLPNFLEIMTPYLWHS